MLGTPLKAEYLCITVAVGGPVSKQGTYTLQMLLGVFRKQSTYTLQMLLGDSLKAEYLLMNCSGVLFEGIISFSPKQRKMHAQNTSSGP